MKPSYFLLATMAVLAGASCNAEKASGNSAAAAPQAKAAPVKPPANGDWRQIVTETSAGGFMMGNPNAKIKLVEFGSLTCPHCRAFEQEGAQPLIDNYVKGGKVSYEFRNFVRDPFDIAAALVARCNGTKTFFPLTKAIYDAQPDWITKIQTAPREKMEAIQNMDENKQFLAIAQLAGLQQMAVAHGVPAAKTAQCLTDTAKIDQLVQMNSDAANAYPDMLGTPTFIINGKMVEKAATWEQLEPELKAALGG